MSVEITTDQVLFASIVVSFAAFCWQTYRLTQSVSLADQLRGQRDEALSVAEQALAIHSDEPAKPHVIEALLRRLRESRTTYFGPAPSWPVWEDGPPDDEEEIAFRAANQGRERGTITHRLRAWRRTDGTLMIRRTWGNGDQDDVVAPAHLGWPTLTDAPGEAARG